MKSITQNIPEHILKTMSSEWKETMKRCLNELYEKIPSGSPVSDFYLVEKEEGKVYTRKDMLNAIEYGASFVSHLKGHPSEDDKTDYLDKLHP